MFQAGTMVSNDEHAYNGSLNHQRSPSFLRFLCKIELSLQSRAPFIFQMCCEPDNSLRFLCEIELWLQSRAPFIFQKCCEPDSFLRFFCDLYFCLRCLVHLLPNSSSKSAPSPIVFYGFYVRSSSGYTV
jgi:hypothetical protein